MNKLIWGALAMTVCSLTACTDDEEKYGSEPPLLRDITVKLLNGETRQDFHVGDCVVITAEQKKRGKLLNATNYKWETNPEEPNRYKKSVIYDNESANPTDTVTLTRSGIYTVKFSGRYSASGNVNYWSGKYGSTYREDFPGNNGFAKYVVSGIMYFNVTAEKNIKVLP